MMFRKRGDTAVQQILAVGDDTGNLHILGKFNSFFVHLDYTGFNLRLVHAPTMVL